MTETLATRKPLTGYHLKLIALVTMFIDHITVVLVPSGTVRLLLRGIGRMSFPIYVFLIAEGCRYTRDRFKYAMRLGLFALISEIPYDMALYPEILEQTGWGWNFFDRTSVFYTMFLAVSAVYIFETLRRQFRSVQWAGIRVVAAYFISAFLLNFSSLGGAVTWETAIKIMSVLYILYTPILLLMCRWCEKKYPDVEWAEKGMLSNILAAVPLLLILLEIPREYHFGVDYGVFGVTLIFLIYLAKDRRWQCGILTLGILYHYAWPPARAIFLQGVTTINIPYVLARVFFALLSAVLIYFAYNGQRGKQAKWGFYAAYPAHLAVLAAIRAVLKI